MSDDAVRRQNEINMFSAMASGEFSGTFDLSGAVGGGSFDARPSNASLEGGASEEAEAAPSAADSMRNMFAQAANDGDSSGTFNFSAPKSDAGRLNLEAAAAALDDDEPNAQPPAPAATSNTPFASSPTSSFNKLKNRTPMHSQEVQLCRPLFFGCRLPPRVVDESKKIVREALQRNERLPPEVRNLMSVIRTFGNGASILPGGDDQEATPNVSVFCPKWSEEIKEEPQSKSFAAQQPDGDDSSLIAETTTKSTAAAAAESTQEEPTPTTAAGQSSDEKPAAALSERDMFSMWAQGDYDDTGSTGNASAASDDCSLGSVQKPKIQREPSLSSVVPEATPPVPMSDQDLFSLWARGESPANNDSSTMRESLTSSMRFNGSVAAAPTKQDFFNAGTFMNVGRDDDSDDDSVVGSELKKKVGANEHLNAALASLEEDWLHGGNNDEVATAVVMEEAIGLTQVPLTPDGTRALTNHELMNGCTPLFGVDDPPLPVEGDLGIHETRDEQQRSREQRRNQAIIESCCPQNVFGPVACPNPALSPDDNHSWNSRAAPSLPHPGIPASVVSSGIKQGLNSARTPKAKSKSPSMEKAGGKMASPSLSKASSAKGSVPFQNRKFDSKSRFGWWNVPATDETDENAEKADEPKNVNKSASDAAAEEAPYVLPPWEHSSSKVLIQTHLEPTPEQLREQNRSLAHLHPATSLAQALPFLSDRPPSYRYLQIDTQAVGFPTIGGEVEPLFCSLAIYHVETTPHNRGDAGSAPLPDLQRCGKITETLNFDVVSDFQVEKHCAGALWPYKSENSADQLQGTRCGVFPLPSNLNIHNLYAILTVSKVVSESSDFEVYLRATKPGSAEKQEKVDTHHLRSKAEKAAKRQGKFLMPFAFGVAPLLQVFGADVPVVPSSRAVQIPLFRFSSGQGERQIIDHIMVMLYPRANHRSSGIGGAAPVTNGGSAMLVMRNFGYLGLHSVVHKKSSLARDRLVDFTGEVQIRRKGDDEDKPHQVVLEAPKARCPAPKVPEWHDNFIAEPAINGGRNLYKSMGSSRKGVNTAASKSELYAQELAPLSLQAIPSNKPLAPSMPGMKGHRDRPSSSGDDIEPYFHTTFCNHMLVHPRHLQNCPKGNIVMKVEMRDMEWMPDYSAYSAHLPQNGPSIHNPRRGPFLVQGAFTACSSRCIDPRFLDEFKLNLPLLLEYRRTGDPARVPAVLFTVYRLSFSSRKKWGKRIRGNKRPSRKVEEIAGEVSGEGGEEIEPNRTCQLIQLGCGFLPLASNFSLVANGNHDVRMRYLARKPRREICQTGQLSEDTLIISENNEGAKWLFGPDKLDVDDGGEDGESVGSSLPLPDTASATSASDSIAMSETTEDRRQRHNRQKSGMDPMSLQVRISAHSSVHSQNATLCEFMCQEPELPMSREATKLDIAPLLRLSREEIYHSIQSTSSKTTNTSAYDVDKLLISTIDISKSSMCSVSDVSCHLLRIVSHLWKIMLSGVGEPNLDWANPAAIIPLRIQAFATLLQLFGSSTIYLSKRGVTQLDGGHKWNLISLSRVMGLLFDEGALYGSQAQEPFVKEFFGTPEKAATVEAPTVRPRNQKDKRRRHVRSTFEFFNNGDGLGMADGSEKFHGNGTSDADEAAASPNRDGTSSTGGIQSSKTNFALSSDWGEVDDDLVFVGDARTIPDDVVETSPENMKIDSVTDFRSALEMGTRDVGEYDSAFEGPTSSGAKVAIAMIKAFSGPTAGGKHWKTAPVSGLATIKEDGDDPGPDLSTIGMFQPKKTRGPLDALDVEQDYVNSSKGSVKQMRVPKRLKDSSVSNGDKSPLHLDKGTEDMFTPSLGASAPFGQRANGEARIDNVADEPLLSTDPFGLSDQLEAGVNTKPQEAFSSISHGRPERSKHRHRKTQSLTLPTTDAEIADAGGSFLDTIEKSLGISNGLEKSLEKESRVGHAHHRKSASKFCSIDWSIPNDDLSNILGDTSAEGLQTPLEPAADEKIDDTMSTLMGEKDISTKLPNFVDRLVSLGDTTSQTHRWFPFAYEVIIMQWAAILSTQRTSEGNAEDVTPINDADGCLAEAASRTSGVAIACAPVLFEIIKQSLGWRVSNLFSRVQEGDAFKKYPALVTLDDAMQASLEQIVSMITDACLDSRNFDSWETRQTCIDVNDSIIWFLRDLFAFMDPLYVHRLIIVYLSRLAAKDSKHLQDRDSSIGLRCSWEVTKLQMNAISALIRFPDFMKVNSPQMNNVGVGWTSAQNLSTVNLFDAILDRYQHYNLISVNASAMKPHWLAEIVVDICLLGTEHAEQNIQRRAASLLLEVFWEQSQQSMRDGNSSIVASMFITFLEKVLSRVSFLSSCFTPKSQVRQDIVRCVAFVLQSAPSLLLRALWRRLCARAAGRSFQDRYGGIGYSVFTESTDDNVYQDSQRRLPSRSGVDMHHDPDILEMFGLLNLCLASLEYEGCDNHAEIDDLGEGDGPIAVWQKDVLLGREQETPDVIRRRRLMVAYGRPSDEKPEKGVAEYTTSSSRKWISHDGSLVVVRAAQQIVRELRFVLEPSEEAQSFFNPARRKVQMKKKHRYHSSFTSLGSRESRINFSYMDTVVFVRAATSVLLHALTLRQSDIALVKILNASVEVIKIFGIKIFNEAVGETLQHWMRVVSFHCGSRRAEVRVPASDFLELILRSTWDSFGSFFRIRLPLLAVQTEVMERIVATAAARHYREQRKMGHGIDLFSNGSAEASLAPLWRTLDRLHHQSASQNVAFRSALIRMAEKLKKLFRAYIAAHALSFLNRSRSPGLPGQEDEAGGTPERNLEAETLIRAGRISVHRVINATAGYSKQFLGLYSTSVSEQSAVAHHEAVEDAFLDAADVFSPTELPDHRVAWLRKLAEFHSARLRYAEEATCHYHIHVTLNQASRLHGALWSSTPFLPWTDNNSDGIHLDGEGPAGEPDESTDFDEFPDEDIDYGRQIDRTNSFRRIFYRNENSIRINGGELEAGSSKYAFCGVTLASEYHTVSPWISLREMEATMLEEAEAAGDLFLKSGIVASSRFAWSLATRHYAEKFCYGKLAHVYERLARTVVSQVPPIDSTLSEVCVTVPLGRFYRVWFHGGAPDELIGAEFVYRSASNVKLDQFGKELKEVIRCIIPDNTPINLVLDGRPAENIQQQYTGFSRMAGAPLEPVRVKVTPLRPMVRKSSRFRGLPEWFDEYIDTAFSGQAARSSALTGQGLRRRGSTYSDGTSSDAPPHHRDHTRSYSASVFSSSGGATTGLGSKMSAFGNTDSRRFHAESTSDGELVGADKFSFMQPINKDRSRGARDWLKGASGDFAEKTLRVTQLQVGQAFPACVSRQAVVHRVVFTQSPLEAAVDAICQWCAILFRTAIATNGMALLGTNYDPGIGIDAAKVVSDCIHSSRVKEMGLYLLKKNTNVEEEEDGDVLQRYDRLGEDEVKKLQLKVARSLIVFMELLHLLIARNRDLLLDVIQERKKGGGESTTGHTRSQTRGDFSVGTINSDARSARSFPARQSSLGAHDSASSQDGKSREDLGSRASHRRVRSTASGGGVEEASNSGTVASVAGLERQRTDSAIGIQSELQRAFISLSKDLHQMIHGIIGNETPRWLKQCCYDNYFSAYTYRSTKIPMGEELAFEDISPPPIVSGRNSSVGMAPSVSAKSVVSGGGSVTASVTASAPPPHSIRTPSSPGGSLGSSSAVSRGSDAARSVKSIRSHKSHVKEHL